MELCNLKRIGILDGTLTASTLLATSVAFWKTYNKYEAASASRF